MSPIVLVLLLIAAFAHAGWNLAAKRIAASGTLFVSWHVARSMSRWARGSGPLLSVSAAMMLPRERPGPLALVGAAAVVGRGRW